MDKKLNIVLVHGAWGDGSAWQHVIPFLVAKGYNVRAVQNPLTSLADDVQRTKNLVASLEGPTLLVGHSYGGMVITEVGNEANVAGLVYIAGWATDAGETIGSLFGLRDAPPGAAVRPDAQGFLWIDVDKFHENFCQDVPAAEAMIMAIDQKPISAQSFGETVGKPAWKEKPSWYQISKNDRMIPPETEAFFAERMKAKTIALDTSHCSFIIQGETIANFILEAAEAVK